MAGLTGMWDIYGGKMTNKPRVISSTPTSTSTTAATPTDTATPIDTSPTVVPPATAASSNGQMGGLNMGMGSIQNILPQYNDPFRTYGTVQNGQVIPPTNPNAPPSNFPTNSTMNTNPINTGPSQSAMSASPYMQGGGFTGNTGISGPTQIPNMNLGNDIFRNTRRNGLFY